MDIFISSGAGEKKPHNLKKKLGPHYFINSEITYQTSYEYK